VSISWEKTIEFAAKLHEFLKPHYFLAVAVVSGVALLFKPELLSGRGISAEALSGVSAVLVGTLCVSAAAFLASAFGWAGGIVNTYVIARWKRVHVEAEIEKGLHRRFGILSEREWHLFADCLARSSPTIAASPTMLPDMAALIEEELIRKSEQSSTDRWIAFIVDPKVWEFMLRNPRYLTIEGLRERRERKPAPPAAP
jgi:hypothetical protein